MFFDRVHILYMLISTLLMVGLLICFKFFIKDQGRKNVILKTCALLTVIIHYSSLYVDYFSYGSAAIENTMLIPIYPCNIAMWMLLIVAFLKNKESKVYKILSEATFYIGITGGIIGIVFNEIYLNNPNLLDWGVLKGLLSHSTMLLGCIYLLVGDYIKIRVSNVLSVIVGLLILLVDGILVISLFRCFKLDPPNAMYLLENPFPNLKWINTWVIGLLAIVICFSITAVYEQITVDKEERWYNKIKKGEIKDERSISKNFWRR